MRRYKPHGGNSALPVSLEPESRQSERAGASDRLGHSWGLQHAPLPCKKPAMPKRFRLRTTFLCFSFADQNNQFYKRMKTFYMDLFCNDDDV